MSGPDKADEKSLAQLRKLLALAEETRLYLDLTGLGCYHKADTPPWYDAMAQSGVPAHQEAGKKIGADIYFGDEAGVRSDHHAGTTWSPRGESSVVSTTGARFGFNMISAVSPRGQMRFMMVDGKVNADTFIEFCKRLLHGTSTPVLLIVDGHPSHKARKVTKWIEQQGGRLQLFLLPGYSPELNPDELVWNGVKNHALGKMPHRDKPTMRKAAESYLLPLQRSPERIKAIFQKPSVRYAT